MKPYFLRQLLLAGWLLTGTGQILAQTAASDRLYRLDGSAIPAKVGEMTATEVFYVDQTSPSTPRKIRKAELWKVVYSDGTAEVFNTPKATESLSSAARPTPANRSAVRPEPVSTPAPPTQSTQSSARPVSESAYSPPLYQSDGPRSILKYAPLSSFGFERVLQNNHSVYVGLSLYSVNAVFTRVTAIGLKGEYRFYGLVKSSPKQAPAGLWVAPTVLFWNVSARDLDIEYTESAFVLQAGGIVGYQWIFGEKVSLEPALGVSLTAVGSGTESILGAGIVPLFALRLGYVLK